MFNFKTFLLSGAILISPVYSFSQSPKKLCDAAEKFEKQKNFEGAIENYSKAIELDPKMDRAYVSRAVCYENLNKKEEAIEDYKKAIAFTPKDKALYYNAGRLLADLSRNKEADEMLRL